MRNFRGCGAGLRFWTIGNPARALRRIVKRLRSIPSVPCVALALTGLLWLPAGALARDAEALAAARAEAESRLAGARAADAAHHAPVELGAAEAALANALAAEERRRAADASVLYRRAALQAELAMARAEAARVREAVRRREAEIDALRADLLPEGSP